MMPSSYQRKSLQAMLGIFFKPNRHPLPQHSKHKSVRRESSQRLPLVKPQADLDNSADGAQTNSLPMSQSRKPFLQIIIDLTSLEKRGKFKALDKLVRICHGKRGLHLLVEPWCVP